eukprot:jgi/Bigna1/76264/fgenesh1_pg.40_\
MGEIPDTTTTTLEGSSKTSFRILPKRKHHNDYLESFNNETKENRFANISRNATSRPLKIMLYIPGIGCKDPIRIRNVLQTVKRFQFTAEETDLHCVIGSYIMKEDYQMYPFEGDRKIIDELEQLCEVFYVPGSHYADFTRFMNPVLVKEAGFDYIIAIQDDVIVGNDFHVDRDLAFVESIGLDIFSPTIAGSTHSLVKRGQDSRVTSSMKVVLTDFIEIFFVGFNLRGWECFYACSDHIKLSKGWGSDLALYPYCAKKHADFNMGVLNYISATHYNPNAALKRPLRHYKEWRTENAGVQMRKFMDVTLNGLWRDFPLIPLRGNHFLGSIDSDGNITMLP